MSNDYDLDAFFDEVSEVEAKASVEEAEAKDKPREDSQKRESEETAEPPPKKQKVAPVCPRGVVVASSTSAVISVKEREEKEAQLSQASKPVAPATRFTGSSAPSTVQTNIGPAIPVAPNPNNPQQQGNKKKGPKTSIRMAAGQKWVDPSLNEWPENDFRIFVGNLANDVSDTMLFEHFQKYPSLAKAKVVRDKKNPEKSKGYGFVSLLDPLECAKALREMDQTWLASRPIRIKRSDWKDRDIKVVKKREKNERRIHQYR